MPAAPSDHQATVPPTAYPPGLTERGTPGTHPWTFNGPEGLQQLSDRAEVTSPTPELFHARVVMLPLNNVWLRFSTSSECTIRRTHDHTAQDTAGRLLISLVLDGTVHLNQNTHQITAGPGDLISRLSELPYVMSIMDDTTFVEVSQPLPDSDAHDRHLLAAVTLPETPMTIAITRLLMSLSTDPPQPNSSQALLAEKILTELVAYLLKELRPRKSAGQDAEHDPPPLT